MDEGGAVTGGESTIACIDRGGSRVWTIPGEPWPELSISERLSVSLRIAILIGLLIAVVRNPTTFGVIAAVALCMGALFLWRLGAGIRKSHQASVEISVSPSTLTVRREGEAKSIYKLDASTIHTVELAGHGPSPGESELDAALMALMDDDKAALLTMRPACLLAPLAEEIAQALTELVAAREVRTRWIDVWRAIEASAQRPAWSRVEFIDDETGWRMVAPARGWSVKSILMSFIGFAFIAAATAGIVYGAGLLTRATPPLALPATVAAAIVLTLGLIFVILSVWHSLSRVSLILAGGVLSIETALSPIKLRRTRPLRGLAAIQCDTTSENGDDFALSFTWRRDHRMRRRFICVGRRREELEWTAVELRARLGVPTSSE